MTANIFIALLMQNIYNRVRYNGSLLYKYYIHTEIIAMGIISSKFVVREISIDRSHLQWHAPCTP